MSLRGRLSLVAELAIVLVVLALVAGQFLGQPILLSYATSGSMEPTIETGEGYVVLPAQVAGPVEEGDIVVFRAEEIQGGGLTVHRIVGETSRGYITQGDANPFTDQDSDEPPVKDAQIVGVVPRVGSTIITIPGLGALVTGTQSVLQTVQQRLAATVGSRSLLGTQGLAYLFFAVTMIWYVVDAWRTQDGRERERADRTRETGLNPHLIAAGFAILIVIGATAAMVGPAGTQEYTIVSADFDSDRPTVIPAGESTTIRYPVGNGGLLPVVAYLEPGSDGIQAAPPQVYVDRRSVANATVTLSAPPETGAYRRFLVEHRYLAIIPTDTIDTLYEIHPWTPIIVIDSLLGIPFYVLSIMLIGGGRIRTRSRSRDRVSSLTRLLNRLS